MGINYEDRTPQYNREVISGRAGRSGYEGRGFDYHGLVFFFFQKYDRMSATVLLSNGEFLVADCVSQCFCMPLFQDTSGLIGVTVHSCRDIVERGLPFPDC